MQIRLTVWMQAEVGVSYLHQDGRTYLQKTNEEEHLGIECHHISSKSGIPDFVSVLELQGTNFIDHGTRQIQMLVSVMAECNKNASLMKFTLFEDACIQIEQIPLPVWRLIMGSRDSATMNILHNHGHEVHIFPAVKAVFKRRIMDEGNTEVFISCEKGGDSVVAIAREEKLLRDEQKKRQDLLRLRYAIWSTNVGIERVLLAGINIDTTSTSIERLYKVIDVNGELVDASTIFRINTVPGECLICTTEGPSVSIVCNHIRQLRLAQADGEDPISHPAKYCIDCANMIIAQDVCPYCRGMGLVME